MNKNEAIKQLGENTKVKFFATLVPPLIYLWQFHSESGKPQHEEMAEQLGLYDENSPVYLRKDVRAGRAIVNNGELVLKGDSLLFDYAMPTKEEFQKITSGDVQIVQRKEKQTS